MLAYTIFVGITFLAESLMLILCAFEARVVILAH